MKKIWQFAVCIGIAAMIMITSCHKDTNTEYGRKLVGKWHSVEVATDNNNNGIMDANELSAIPVSLTSFYTFASDGSGHYTIYDPTSIITANFTSSLANEDHDLKLIVAGTERTDQIDSLTSGTLTLKNKSGNNNTWTIFARD